MEGVLQSHAYALKGEAHRKDEVVVPLRPCGKGYQGLQVRLGHHESEATVIGRHRLQGSLRRQINIPFRFPRHHGGGNGSSHPRKGVTAVDAVIALQIVGLPVDQHTDGECDIQIGVYLQHKGVLVQALGVFVLGVADLGVDIQYHDVAAVAGEGVQQVNGGVRALGRESDLLKGFAVSEGDHLKDPDVPQGHVVGQRQLIGVPRRPQNGKHIPESVQHIHRASAVGVIPLQLPLFVSMQSRFPYAVPLGVHRDPV